jgi:hypothetical protein
MQHDNQATTTPKNRKKYSLPLLSFGVVFFAIIIWFVLVMMVMRKFEIASTHLVLKNEACQLLQAENLKPNYLSGEAALCSLTLPFRANKLGTGGVIFLNDRQINLSEHQIITREIADVPSYTQVQLETLFALLLSTGVMLGAVGWFVLKIRKEH